MSAQIALIWPCSWALVNPAIGRFSTRYVDVDTVFESPVLGSVYVVNRSIRTSERVRLPFEWEILSVCSPSAVEYTPVYGTERSTAATEVAVPPEDDTVAPTARDVGSAKDIISPLVIVTYYLAGLYHRDQWERDNPNAARTPI